MTNIIRPEVGKVEIQDFILWDKLKEKRIPFAFDLEITARCNMNCRHCYINLPVADREAKARELSVTEILNIGRQAVKLGTLWCLISGGEPLLRQDFSEIYLGLKRLGLMVSVFTNATLISEKHIELFRKYPPRDIEVTVYGVTRETYEKVTRRPGSFDQFMAGLEKLRANGLRIRLKAMAIQSNFNEQQAIAEFCWAWTKDYYRFDPQLHLRFDGDHFRNEEIRAERLTAEQILSLEENDEKRFTAMIEKCDTLINDQFMASDSDYLLQCNAGNDSFCISYDGRFRLCSSLWADETTFDLKTGTLDEAWNCFVPEVRSMRSQRKEFLESCGKCAIVNLCMWCPAHAHLETGLLDGSTPYFCELAHKREKSIKAGKRSEE